MNTEENNKMIAEFMGLELEETLEGLFVYARKEQSPIKLNDIRTEFYEVNELQYHTSWNWLMDVVDEIEDYLSDNVGKVAYFDECLSSNDLDVRYQAVVEFINKYNKNQ